MKSLHILLFWVSLASLCLPCEAQLTVSLLRTEGLANPVGIDVAVPAFSWTLGVEEGTLGVRQTAYELSLYKDTERTERLWSSGKVESNQQLDVPYEGPALRPHTRYWWTVRVWDNQGDEATSGEEAWFETGLMGTGWAGAQWIASTDTATGMPRLRKRFIVPDSLRSAKIYASALGVFDLYINGQRVGRLQPDGTTCYDELKPGWTDYRHEVQYFTYDITHLLSTGDNLIEVQLSNGWWGGAIAHGIYGHPRLAFLCRLRMEQDDGQVVDLVSDSSWQGTNCGSLRLGDIYNGETYEAGHAIPETAWLPVEEDHQFTGQVTAFCQQPVRRRPSLDRTPQSLIVYQGTDSTGSTYGQIHVLRRLASSDTLHLQPGETALYDLGQNMVGWVRFAVRSLSAEDSLPPTLTLRFGEMLNDTGEAERANHGPGGSLYTYNLRTARATLHYTLAQSGSSSCEGYEPTTTFMGFRYVEVTANAEVEIKNLTGCVVGSDIEETGTFVCSNTDVNQLFSNILWGQRGNFLSIPTDCPQRDERLGWTADTQVFSRAASYNADTRAFYHQWMTTLRHCQREDGAYPDMAPFCNFWGYGNAAWGDAGIIVPWTVWLHFGDKRILEENYLSMQRYMQWLSTLGDSLYAYNGAGTGMGDWLAYAATDKRFVSVCYYAYVAQLMTSIAITLGHVSDAANYAALYEQIRREFQTRYVTAEGLLSEDTQCAYLLALKFGLLPENAVEKGVQRLAALIEGNDYKLNTGFVGTSILCSTLSDVGLSDLAYDLLLQRQNPSWLYSVDQGATTVWERWDSYTKETGFNKHPWNMNSFNHYAYGVVAEWLYRYVGGIETDPAAPGFQHIVLQPTPDRRTFLPAGQERITWATATYRSPYGLIRSHWEQLPDGRYQYEVTVPPNTTATLRLPEQEISLESGTYTFIGQ